MGWREQLREGSFRGARFFVERAEGELGRRTVVHQFPLRDTPEIEDLGAEARLFTLEVFCVGADYMAARDALLSAIEQAGPGALVHPYLGEMQASVNGRARFIESSREGGMARFTIPMARHQTDRYPQAGNSTVAQVTAATAVVMAELPVVLAAELSVADRPAFVLDAAAELMQRGVGDIGALVRTVSTLPGRVAAVVDLASTLSNTAINLLFAPATLVASLSNLARQLRDAATSPFAAFESLSGLLFFADDLASVPTPTANRAAQAKNQAVLTQTLRAVVAVECAQAAAAIDYPSLDDARRVRDRLIVALDDLAERAASDTLYFAMVDVRTAVARDIAVRGANLSRLARVELAESLPATVLCWRLYADTNREADLIARNRIADPLFLPAQQPLEVLQ